MAQPKSRSAGCVIAAAVLLVLLLAPVALFWYFVRSLEGGHPVSVESGSVLELDLGAVSGEGPSAIDLGSLFGGGAMSLWDLGRTIDRAAKDDDVVAMRLVLRGAQMGW